MFIRKATINDIAAADEIYNRARSFMKESENPTNGAAHTLTARTL